jgi:predicted Zn finger-like uncharacterized protein
MIITCPHCQTKYQVTYEAIGSAGRKVQCANCQQAWKQQAFDEFEATEGQKRAIDALEEDQLDDAISTEEHNVALELARQIQQEVELEAATSSPKKQKAPSDPAVLKSRQRAFRRRQHAMEAELPLARMRRAMRAIGAVVLVALLCIAYFGRTQLVLQYPEMAAFYKAIGLEVNVVGLDFSNVTAMRTTRNGTPVLVVSAQLVGLKPNPQQVPPVVVTLLNEAGKSVYEWSVTPSVRDMMAGERSTFDTQIATPPADAVRVRLRFSGGQAQPNAPQSIQNADEPLSSAPSGRL